jgi:serine/threonine protein kinase
LVPIPALSIGLFGAHGWLAQHAAAHSGRVALKLLPAEMAADPERLQRFEREARAVAALNHPNIVNIYSVEEAGGVPSLTLELVEGKTLGELIPKGGPPLAEMLTLAVPLADATWPSGTSTGSCTAA